MIFIVSIWYTLFDIHIWIEVYFSTKEVRARFAYFSFIFYVIGK